MPICTVQLLSLNSSIDTFLTALRKSSLKPLTVARVVRWIITPTFLSREPLLSQSPPWDVLLILPDAIKSLPADLESLVRSTWSIQAGVPSKLISSFDLGNSQPLHPSPDTVPPLTGSLANPQKAGSTPSLELTDHLQSWIQGGKGPKGAISMLNLLAFRPGKKEQYLKYGKAFSESVGSRRGGVAKLVGKIVPGTCSDACSEWEEVGLSFWTYTRTPIVTTNQFALAHYPSLDHFADMLASKDYQQANKTWRVPSLKDTFILCTTELDLLVEPERSKL